MTTAPASPPATKSTRAPSAPSGVKGEIVDLVNQERAKAGCRTLAVNTRLADAAQKYTDVMARTGEFSHTGPDGSTVASRIEAEGYRWSAVGENIARGQQDAAAVMDSWMASPGHRANILNCSYREIGVGVHTGDDGPWWTQDFATSG